MPDGRAVPGTFATNDEHLALADGMNDAGGGLFQVVCDFESRAGNEFQLLRTMAEHAGDVLFAIGPGNDESMGLGVVDLWGGFLADANTAGRATGYTMTRPSGSLMGLAQVPPVKGGRWREVMTLPTMEDRLAALRDDATRAELVEEGRAKGLIYDPRHIHPLGTGEHPEYDVEGGTSVADLADAAGVDPVELVIDRLLESEGRELFNLWFFHRNRAAIGPLAGPRPRLPGRRGRRRPRRPDLRRRRRHPLPRPLVAGRRACSRFPRRSTASPARPRPRSAWSTAAPCGSAPTPTSTCSTPPACASATRPTSTTSRAAPVASASGPRATRRRWSTARSSPSRASTPAPGPGRVLREFARAEPGSDLADQLGQQAAEALAGAGAGLEDLGVVQRGGSSGRRPGW